LGEYCAGVTREFFLILEERYDWSGSAAHSED
jgi:hypothetical protein